MYPDPADGSPIDLPDDPPAVPPPVAKSSRVVGTGADARGNPYPESLRGQQVGLSVARAVVERIDAALAGPPVKLATAHLGENGKAHVRAYLLSALLPELYADPIPARVKPAERIVSPKALSLLDRRMDAAFSPPGGVLELPGLRLTSPDLFALLTRVRPEVMRDETGFGEDDPPPAVVAVPVPVTTPPAVVAVPVPVTTPPAVIADRPPGEGTVRRANTAATTARRRELIRLARQKQLAVVGWTPEMDAALGTAPDDVTAGRVGRTTGAVQQRRYKLGIPRFGKGERPTAPSDAPSETSDGDIP